MKVQHNFVILLLCFTTKTVDFYLMDIRDPPPGIIGDKLNLKELFAKIFMTGSRGLVSSPFIAAISLFFARNKKLVKDFLTELYYNLSVEILSKDNNEVLKIDALTDL